MAKKNANASLSYFLTDGIGQRAIALWIDVVSQTNELSGSNSQSRLTNHFYPHAYMPGNYQIQGTCESQDEYVTLGTFIRNHQLAMMDQPVTENFSRVQGQGYRRLLTLSVPSESIWIRGFVPRITITRKGVFEPAPQFNFEFVVIFDSHSTDIRLSSDIRKYFQGGFDASAVIDTPAPESAITASPGVLAGKNTANDPTIR